MRGAREHSAHPSDSGTLALAQLFPALVHEVEARGDGEDALVVAREHDRDVGELLHLALDRGHALEEAERGHQITDEDQQVAEIDVGGEGRHGAYGTTGGMIGSLNRPSAPPERMPLMSVATSRLAAPASAAQLVESGLSGRSAVSSSDIRSMLVMRCGSGSESGCPAASVSGFCCAVSMSTQACQHGADTTLLVALAMASAYSKSGSASLSSLPTRSAVVSFASFADCCCPDLIAVPMSRTGSPVSGGRAGCRLCA